MVFIPIRLRNQIWDKYHFSGTQLWQRRAKGREFIMPPRRTGFNEYMPQGQRTHDLEHERLLRAGWAVHAGVGLFNQKGNKFMYGNLTAGGFFGWMGREQLGAGRVMARALIPYPHYPHGSRGPLRLDREGECPGTVAFISCLDSEIDDLGVILL